MTDDTKIISSRKIYEVLDFVKRRPELWLTSKSITGLQNFINGFMRLGAADDIYHPSEPTIDEFNYWILQKDAGLSGIQNLYSRVLLRECNGDDLKAFDKFFDYLDEFKKEHATR
jgi:hypothetical protein